MPSFTSRIIKFLIRRYLAHAKRDDWTVEQRRRHLLKLTRRYLKTPQTLISEKVEIGDIPAQWLTFPTSHPQRIVYYLHGGAYVMCSIETHRYLIAKIARAADARVLAIDYRLAPEHPYPAALRDALAGYHWLLEQVGDPNRIVIAGDSAGGGLTVSLLIALREKGLPLPAAAVCLCPWADLTLSGESMRTKANEEIIIPVKYIPLAVEAYLDGTAADTTTVSPIFADLTGLPPMLIQAGTSEVLLDDAKRLAQRARDCGVETSLEIWDGMIHVWHFFAIAMPEARAAIRRVGDFIKEKIPSKNVENRAVDAS